MASYATMACLCLAHRHHNHASYTVTAVGERRHAGLTLTARMQCWAETACKHSLWCWARATRSASGSQQLGSRRVLLVRQCLRLPAVGFTQLNRVWSASTIALPQLNHKKAQLVASYAHADGSHRWHPNQRLHVDIATSTLCACVAADQLMS
jgi:hypothetical protein